MKTEHKMNFKSTRTAYRSLRFGKTEVAREIFSQLANEKNRYRLIGYIGLAASEAAERDYSIENIKLYLSKAAENGAFITELTDNERTYIKKLINNSHFPEYKLPLLYFAIREEMSSSAEILIMLGANKSVIYI